MGLLVVAVLVVAAPTDYLQEWSTSVQHTWDNITTTINGDLDMVSTNLPKQIIQQQAIQLVKSVTPENPANL